jgi:hypothetical protein
VPWFIQLHGAQLQYGVAMLRSACYTCYSPLRPRRTESAKRAAAYAIDRVAEPCTENTCQQYLHQPASVFRQMCSHRPMGLSCLPCTEHPLQAACQPHASLSCLLPHKQCWWAGSTHLCMPLIPLISNPCWLRSGSTSLTLPALACTTSVPPSWVRLVRASSSSGVRETLGVACGVGVQVKVLRTVKLHSGPSWLSTQEAGAPGSMSMYVVAIALAGPPALPPTQLQ